MIKPVKKLDFHMCSLFFLIFSIIILGCQSNFQDKNLSESDDTNNITCASETRKLTFSGYNWTVRTSDGQLQGPGPNYFSDSSDNVWLDDDGYLHLKIIKSDGKWYCAEVYSDLSFGYGSYIFKLSPGFENLDVNLVVGLFTYLDDENEIDIEFARWGKANAQNGQFVVQPYSNIGNLFRFNMPEKEQKSIHSFTWCKEYIKFWSAWGSNINYKPKDLISKWFYTGNDNPKPSTERVHINLWLMEGLAPTDAKEAEIVIKEFEFLPSNCDDPIPLPLWVFWTLISTAIIGISIFTIFIFIRKRRKPD